MRSIGVVEASAMTLPAVNLTSRSATLHIQHGACHVLTLSFLSPPLHF
jgi:hypothetical protein